MSDFDCTDPRCCPTASLQETRRVLYRKEEILRLLVDSVEDYAIFALDPEGYVTSWNKGAERVKGYTEGEILGKHFSLFYPPEDAREGRPEHGLRLAAAEGRFEALGWRVRKDGSRFWANVVISPLRDESGQLIGFAKVTRDLTERRLAEERARDVVREQTAREVAEVGRARIVAILESISDGFFAVDPEGRFRYVNRRAEEILRRSREELLGSSLWEELPGLIGPAALDQCHRVAGERRHAEFEHFCAPLDIWLHVHVYPSDEGLSVYFHDISVQKHAQEALRGNEQRLREIVDLLPIGAFLTDPHGQIVWHNPAGRTIWGGTRLVGTEGYDEYKAWWPGTGRRVRAEEWAVAGALKGEAVTGQVIEIERFADGARRTILNSAFPLRDASGRITGAVVLNEDVTERRQVEAALRASDEVLGTVSHELRGSLHAILLQLTVLGLSLPEAAVAQVRPRLEAIEQSTELMARLVDDLADRTRTDAGGHGGRIWAESTPGEGTTFHFTLPVADRPTAQSGEEASRETARETGVRAVAENRHTAESRERDAFDLAGAAERRTHFLAALNQRPDRLQTSAGALSEFLHDRVTAAVHLGELLPGDRLPSIRELSDVTAATPHAVVRAYGELQRARLVESRDRSGMYVAAEEEAGEDSLGETAEWLASVLSDAWQHRIKIPHLPHLIERYTRARRLRCACIDSDRDYLEEICTEFTQEFGIESHPVHAATLLPYAPGEPVKVDRLSAELRKADLVVTSAFCAPRARAVADALGLPVVTVTLNPEHVDEIERRARRRGLTVVCTDPAFGERIRSLRGGRYRHRIRVVLAHDAQALAELDSSEPVLLTRAANTRLDANSLRLVVPFAPCISPRSARTLARLVVRLNVQAPRG